MPAEEAPEVPDFVTTWGTEYVSEDGYIWDLEWSLENPPVQLDVSSAPPGSTRATWTKTVVTRFTNLSEERVVSPPLLKAVAMYPRESDFCTSLQASQFNSTGRDWPASPFTISAPLVAQAGPSSVDQFGGQLAYVRIDDLEYCYFVFEERLRYQGAPIAYMETEERAITWTFDAVVPDDQLDALTALAEAPPTHLAMPYLPTLDPNGTGPCGPGGVYSSYGWSSAPLPTCPNAFEAELR